MEKNKQNKITQILAKAKVTPDEAWQKTTYQNLEKFVTVNAKSSTKKQVNLFTLIFNYFTMQKKYAVTLAASLAVVLLAGGVGANLLLNKSKSSTTISPLSLSESEKQQIYQNVLQNNSLNSIKTENSARAVNNTTAEALTAGKMSGNSDAAMVIDPYYGQQYSYYYDKSTSYPGAAASQCSFIVVDTKQTVTWENYNYFDGTNNYYKYLTYNADKSDLTYSFGYNQDNKNITYDYRGGSYAVKLISDYTNLEVMPVEKSTTNQSGSEVGSSSDPGEADLDVTVMPSNAVDTPDATISPDQSDVDSNEPNDIKQYFGDNADIIGTGMYNGKEYFIIQTDYLTDCDTTGGVVGREMLMVDQVMPAAFDDKIVEQLWVDKTSFAIAKSQTYLNTVADQNLIVTHENDSQYSNLEFQQVADKFKFDYPVEVKEVIVDYSYDPGKEITALSEYFSNNQLTLLHVTDAKYKVNSIFAPVASRSLDSSYNYMYDRSFYASGDQGEKQYQDAIGLNSDYVEPLVSISYTGPEKFSNYASTMVFDGQKTDIDKVKTSNLYSDAKAQDVSITINDVQIPAQLYINKYDNVKPLLEEQSAEGATTMPISEGDGLNYQDQVLLFEYNGFIYYVSLGGTNQLDYQTFVFEFLNTDVDQGISKINELVDQYKLALEAYQK